MEGDFSLLHVCLILLFDGCWHFRQPSIGSLRACGGVPGEGVARVDGGEAAVAERGAGDGVVERERGAGGSIERHLDGSICVCARRGRRGSSQKKGRHAKNGETCKRGGRRGGRGPPKTLGRELPAPAWPQAASVGGIECSRPPLPSGAHPRPRAPHPPPTAISDVGNYVHQRGGDRRDVRVDARAEQ